jgi:hypothetical protein
MKNIVQRVVSIWITAFSIMVIFACQKKHINAPIVSSLTITNAVIDGASIRLGSIVTPVTNNSFQQFTVFAGDNDLYVWPTTDSTKPYYANPKFYFEEREVYSLFLAGQLSDIRGIVIKENIPYHTDSTCGIRFINLVPNSVPLNITLSTTPAISEVSNLTYLQYTDFRMYPAKTENSSYAFQIRNSIDNSLVANYTLASPFPRFANVTLVIRGIMKGNPAVGVTRVNNDR